MLDLIHNSWCWSGLDPSEVLAENAFGNVIVRATNGVMWRICPEELSCEIVAENAAKYATLSDSEQFRTDWEMARLVALAEKTCGPLAEGRCYCLKMPAVLGGAYDAANLGTITREERLAFTGDLAEQIQDLPDGSQIKFDWVE
jgi:hypothetical protein